jgi:TldD protein
MRDLQSMSLDGRTARRFLDSMTEECLRQKRYLRVSGYPRPYYISYLLRDIHSTTLWGRLGNINQMMVADSRNAFCDVRVGSYRFDQVTEGGLDDHDTELESYDHVEMPIGNDQDALKYHLWKLTDSRYREAVKDYFAKKSHRITFVDPNRSRPSFSRMRALRDNRFSGFPRLDVDAWRQFVVRSSRLTKGHPEIKSSSVEVRIRDITRLFVNSEGSSLIDRCRICELSCDLWLLTPAGESVATRVVHITPSLADLPTEEQFGAQIRERITLISRLAQAPTLKSYAGPVLLAPGPAGILFHEVLGHRLEGSRLLSTHEGQTFARDLGKQIVPPFISVIDDPTLDKSAGRRTVGHYRYDDEGTPAEKVVLVDRGKLVSFLSTRAPYGPGGWRRSNGHARGEHHERPVSRMGNLVVQAEGGISHPQLKQRFIEEIKQQKLPYGIMILDAEGGETATESYDFQAFMGQVSLAVQVWVDGRENLVRNVNFVGTPLSALRNIIAVGDTPVCENAYCGAESGVVPVSTTSPAVLMSNLELQATDQRKYTQYVVPMPHERSVND